MQSNPDPDLPRVRDTDTALATATVVEPESVVQAEPSDGAPGGPGDGTFTRDDLEDAELERPPSVRRRFVVGLGLGLFALAAGSWAGAAVFMPIAAIPVAWTWAGAGVLVGFGLPATVVVILQWPAVADAGAFIGAVLATAYVIGCLAVGIAAVLGRLVAARLGYVIGETGLFRPRQARRGPR